MSLISMLNYSTDDVILAVKQSKSIRQVIIILGLKPAGGNYKTVHELIKKLNLDTSHFTGQGWTKGRLLPLKRPIQEYLNNQFKIMSSKLRKRLIRENLLEEKCYNCNNKTWMGGKIPLELEHIDGNSLNNNLSNLTLLCPNCHALTPTYRRRKKLQ